MVRQPILPLDRHYYHGPFELKYVKKCIHLHLFRSLVEDLMSLGSDEDPTDLLDQQRIHVQHDEVMIPKFPFGYTIVKRPL